MRKKVLAIVVLTVTFFISLHVIPYYKPEQELPGDHGVSTDPKEGINSGEGSEGGQAEADPIRFLLERMTLEQKVGQLVIAGLDGYEYNDNAQKLIENYHVGGFVLLKKNIRDINQTVALINALKKANSSKEIPLFLAVDEEGGRITRMPPELPALPASERVGKVNSSELSYEIGKIMGERLKALGLNMNFAPVLDINNNPQNVVIGDRSYGSDPEIVSDLGVATMKGLQAQNTIPVVKHFPGHGDTAVDSHVGLPVIDHDLQRLQTVELQPFAAAIANNADAVMLAHILLPRIDPMYPASFSKTIISDILRQELGFDGVVITDDMTMGAVTRNYDIGQAAVEAIKAGGDIVLVCHDYAKEEAVVQALYQAAKSGEISEARLDESVYRILKLKNKYALSDDPVESVDVERLNERMETLYREYPSLNQ